MKRFNWKVAVGVAAAAVVIWAVAPGSVAALAPLLLLAVCPLSMLLMMRAMSSAGGCSTGRDDEMAKLRAELEELRSGRTAAGAGEA